MNALALECGNNLRGALGPVRRDTPVRTAPSTSSGQTIRGASSRCQYAISSRAARSMYASLGR